MLTAMVYFDGTPVSRCHLEGQGRVHSRKSSGDRLDRNY